MSSTCKEDGCDFALLARGWCRAHYLRWWRGGDPKVYLPRRGAPSAERFWAYVNKTETCWLWTGPQINTGYGMFRRRVAHRWSYEQVNGPVPAGLELDHLCRTPLCVRPNHLEAVTHSENMLRSFASRR